MRKIVIFYCLIFGSLTCSEKGIVKKITDVAKNKVDAHAKRMMSTITYENGSFEQLRDSVALFVLPEFCAQAVLQQQRNNMRRHLIKNEERALEGIRLYWGLDEKSWEDLLEQNRKEHASNIAQLRSENSMATFHHKSLPCSWIAAVQHECNRYRFNINNLGLGVTDDRGILGSTKELSNAVKSQLGLESTVPVVVNFSMQYAHRPQASIQHTAIHELTHVVKGDALLMENIIMLSSQKNLENGFNKIQERIEEEGVEESIRQMKVLAENIVQKGKEFSSSAEHAVLVAAQEKTADTYVMCADQAAAQNISDHIKFSGYENNHNDMKAISHNWRTHQVIEDSKPLRKAIGYGDQVCVIF